MISPYVIYLRSQIEENMIKKMQEPITHVIAVMGNGLLKNVIKLSKKCIEINNYKK